MLEENKCKCLDNMIQMKAIVLLTDDLKKELNIKHCKTNFGWIDGNKLYWNNSYSLNESQLEAFTQIQGNGR